MKTPAILLAAALLLGGCATTESAVPAAAMDPAARALAEKQAAAEARANAARDIAMAQQAEREVARREAEARAAAEAEQARSEEAQAEQRAAEEAARRVIEESALRQAEARAAEERAAREAAEKSAAEAAAAAKAAADKAAADAAKEKTVTTADAGDLNVVAELETSLGTLVLGFFPDVAPGHVKNFVDLARKGFYDGTRFHRVIPGFMIQGGDPLTRDPAQSRLWGTGDPGYKIKAEFNARPHLRGTLSMARSSSPDSAGSQFFICHAAAPHLDRQYSVFGELLSGYDVLDRIAAAPNQPGSDRPKEAVTVTRVTIRPRTPADVKKGG